MKKKIKGLPRDKAGKLKRTFVANNKAYTIRTADEGVSIRRFNEYEKLSLVLGFGASFETLVKNINQAIEMTNDIFSEKAKTSDLVLHLDAVRNGIIEASKDRYNVSLYLCSLFIVTKDEELTQWSSGLAEEKINDWNMEGYDVNDFLLLAVNSIRGFKDVYQVLLNRLDLTAQPNQ